MNNKPVLSLSRATSIIILNLIAVLFYLFHVFCVSYGCCIARTLSHYFSISRTLCFITFVSQGHCISLLFHLKDTTCHYFSILRTLRLITFLSQGHCISLLFHLKDTASHYLLSQGHCLITFYPKDTVSHYFSISRTLSHFQFKIMQH